MSDAPTTWNDQQRERFLVGLQRLEGAPTLAQLEAFCRANGRPVPAELTELRRARLLVWLSEARNRRRVTDSATTTAPDGATTEGS